MRRLCGLVLAVGLLPAASGGSACVAHWVGGGDLHAQSAERATGETHEHASPRVNATHGVHAHMTPEHAAHAHGSPAAPGPELPSSHNADVPCTALAACGVLAAFESPARPLPAAAPTVAVRGGPQLAPPGPAPAPDVPPPRR